MRQVPHPLIIGNGKMAQHFGHYLSLLRVDYCQWSRNNQTPNLLKTFIDASTVIILLISDSSLKNFIDSYPCIRLKPLIHFSGALFIEGVQAAHPLMTFHDALYDFETYKRIPFILERGVRNRLYFLPNAFFEIPAESKAYYHMLCVLSGNFTAILWKKFFNELETRFQLPSVVGEPYLKQIMSNILKNPDKAITGPLVRNDTETLNRHLEALQNDDFKLIYQSFVSLFEKGLINEDS